MFTRPLNTGDVKAIMLLNVLLVTIAFALIVLVMADGLHFNGLHQVLGLTIFAVMFLQSVLGQVINRLWNPDRKGVPWHDRMHWWLGRIITVLAFIKIYFGLNFYGVNNSSLMIAFSVWTVLVIGFCVWREAVGSTSAWTRHE